MKRNTLFNIFNFLVCGFFVSSIVSISIFTFFQVLLIFFAIFEFFFDDTFRKSFNLKLDLKTIGYLLILIGFIISFIFTSSIKNSIYRLPIYAIVILLIPSSYILFLRFKEEIKNIDTKYLIINIFITLIIIYLNFFYILKSNKNLSLIFKDRQVGFLRNSVVFAYCMIFPIFYLFYNSFLLFRKNKIIVNLMILPFIILAIGIQIILVISSGTRTAFFSFLFSFILFLICYILIMSKKVFKNIFSFFIILLVIFIVIYLSLHLIKLEKTKMLYNTLNEYTSKKQFYNLNRFINSFDSIYSIFSLIKNPTELSKYNIEEYFRASSIISSIKIIQRRFFIGTGPFSWYYYIKQNKDLSELFHPDALAHSHCHNDLLQIFAEFGVFVFSGFIILILISLINIFILIKEKRIEGVVLFSILIVLILGGLTDYLFGHPLIGPYYGFFIGLFLSLNNSKELKEKNN